MICILISDHEKHAVICSQTHTKRLMEEAQAKEDGGNESEDNLNEVRRLEHWKIPCVP